MSPAPYTATVLIPAAGSGSRYGRPKQLEPLCGVPVLRRTVEVAGRVPGVQQIVVATAAALMDESRALVENIVDVPVHLVEGGATRTDSVRRAFTQASAEVDLVVVHDAARPMASVALYERVMSCAHEHGAAIPALPVSDTLKRAEGETPRVSATVDRTGLWAVQTPQAFQRALLAEALADAEATATDEAGLVERLGHAVHIVEGDIANHKITRPDDLALAELLLRARAGLDAVRVGIGRDRHPLEAGRPLVLAGIEIAGAPAGPVGHSDGDALCHAIADAILGAAGAGDLGGLYPDDAAWTQGLSGDRILRGAVQVAAERGLSVSSVDATLWIARPRLAESLGTVRAAVAAALGIDEGRVNLKAKSGNDIDAVGRGEATEGEAIVVLSWR